MSTKTTAPPISIEMDDMHFRYCPHCDTETVQVGERPDGWPLEPTGKQVKIMGHCLQCIADGGTCCTLEDFNRWGEEEAQ